MHIVLFLFVQALRYKSFSTPKHFSLELFSNEDIVPINTGLCNWDTVSEGLQTKF